MTNPIQIKNLLLGSGIPKICVPLTAASSKELYTQAREAASAGADLIEWRVDFFEALDQPQKIVETLDSLADILGQIPLLFTIRTKAEGGNRPFTTKDYVNLNLLAANTGKTDLVDVEVFGCEEEKKALIRSLKEAGAVVVGSSHDFEKTDDKDTLLKRFCAIEESGADILKMAVMPHEFEDTAALMQATSIMAKEYTDKPLISMAMGNVGAISRISGENFGSCVTFGTVGEASAPGQFPIRELRMMMEALHEKNRE
ncbi:type I 3-dehydroquinate dehydratase [Blautia schinkii]|nr:type I 3-dehydroquinate dehydratase [Blautia schinkii]